MAAFSRNFRAFVINLGKSSFEILKKQRNEKHKTKVPKNIKQKYRKKQNELENAGEIQCRKLMENGLYLAWTGMIPHVFILWMRPLHILKIVYKASSSLSRLLGVLFIRRRRRFANLMPSRQF